MTMMMMVTVDLSTDEVAARRGWVTMSTKLCDSCNVDLKLTITIYIMYGHRSGLLST